MRYCMNSAALELKPAGPDSKDLDSKDLEFKDFKDKEKE